MLLSTDFQTIRSKMTRGSWLSAWSLVIMLAPAAAETVTIKILPSPSRFESPARVKVGDVVQWTNDTGADHTATPLDKNDSFKGAPNEIGGGKTSPPTAAVQGPPRTINYRCEIHPTMVGEIIVEATAR